MHNLLSTLEDEGLVSRDSRTKEYRLGPALITLGAAATGQTRLIDIATERLAPLTIELGLSFAVAQPVGDYESVIVERFYPPERRSRRDQARQRLRALRGRARQVHARRRCRQPEVERILAKRSIPAHTDRTLTRPERSDRRGRAGPRARLGRFGPGAEREQRRRRLRPRPQRQHRAAAAWRSASPSSSAASGSSRRGRCSSTSPVRFAPRPASAAAGEPEAASGARIG